MNIVCKYISSMYIVNMSIAYMFIIVIMYISYMYIVNMSIVSTGCV